MVLYSPLSRAMPRELKRRHHVFEFGAIALVFIHLAGYPPEFVYPTRPDRGRGQLVSDDASIYSRLCRAVRTLAHLLSALKKWACMAELGHIFIGNRSATLFHRSAATACFAKECQMIRCSYLERNHCNPADSALSTVASSVGSTARSIVHFARQPSLCLFHLWINKETKRDDSLIWFVSCIFLALMCSCWGKYIRSFYFRVRKLFRSRCHIGFCEEFS